MLTIQMKLLSKSARNPREGLDTFLGQNPRITALEFGTSSEDYNSPRLSFSTADLALADAFEVGVEVTVTLAPAGAGAGEAD